MGLTLTIDGTKAKLRRNSAVFISVGKTSKAKLKRSEEELGWPSFVSDSGRCKLAYFTDNGFRGDGWFVPFSGWALQFNGVLHWLDDFEEKLRRTRTLNFSFHTRMNKCVDVIGSRELRVLENDFINALRLFLCQPIVIEIVLEFLDPAGFRGVTELPLSMMYREDTSLPTRPKILIDAKGHVEVMVRKLDLKKEVQQYVVFQEGQRPRFRCVENKLRVERTDMLTMVNGVDLSGLGRPEVLKTIHNAPKRVIIRLLKLRLWNTRMIDLDTIECQDNPEHLLQIVRHFCDLKDGVPTFRCIEPKIFVEKGDQLLRLNEEDTTNIEAKDDIIAMIQSCHTEVTIWIRKKGSCATELVK